MYKRLILLSIVAAVLAGCQSKTSPADMDMTEEVNVERQVQAEANTDSDTMQAAPSSPVLKKPIFSRCPGGRSTSPIGGSPRAGKRCSDSA